MTPYPVTSGPGIVTFMMTLIAGASLYPVNIATRGARAVLETARVAQITMITGLPALLRMLLGLDGAQVAFSHLRAIYTTASHRCVPTSMPGAASCRPTATSRWCTA